ncbi:LPP20 family lipoprotein [Acetonema longum]|uniref:Lipoprotein LPP20-like domain-containing protein n=1 Tax=Acetonema longum DSM 6540 TaxID=1009370 RepID=F7NIY7_9FIRM|nr:LPP20 family lipoprotein [Acetonema longum]EGO63984.1 hypothetical protein ALO_10199 [Acetonema longum DSM 6540]
MSRKAWICLVLSLLLLVLPLVTYANNAQFLYNNNDPYASQPVADGNGLVNWETDSVEAIGFGVPPANAFSSAQARNMARRAAIADAQRNLLESVQGVQVDSETTVENLAVSSDVINTRMSGMLKGYKIVNEQQMPDGSYQVVISVRMYGQNSLANAISGQRQPQRPFPPAVQPYPQQQPNQPHQGYQPTQPAVRQYTGLVIDARRLGLERTMTPMIYDETGKVIYGNMYVDQNYVVQNGLVDYAASPGAIELIGMGQSRAGADYIEVKAIKLRDRNRNIVISAADGDRILNANGPTGFLLKCNVVIKH